MLALLPLLLLVVVWRAQLMLLRCLPWIAALILYLACHCRVRLQDKALAL
jgi:hypothetical protein